MMCIRRIFSFTSFLFVFLCLFPVSPLLFETQEARLRPKEATPLAPVLGPVLSPDVVGLRSLLLGCRSACRSGFWLTDGGVRAGGEPAKAPYLKPEKAEIPLKNDGKRMKSDGKRAILGFKRRPPGGIEGWWEGLANCRR